MLVIQLDSVLWIRLPIPATFAVCHPPISLPISCQPTVLSQKYITKKTIICTLKLLLLKNSFHNVFFKVPGATQAELTCVAQRTQNYVCRVNDRFCNCVFSDWVKVKVMDVDKPGKKPMLYCKT